LQRALVSRSEPASGHTSPVDAINTTSNRGRTTRDSTIPPDAAALKRDESWAIADVIVFLAWRPSKTGASMHPAQRWWLLSSSGGPCVLLRINEITPVALGGTDNLTSAKRGAEATFPSTAAAHHESQPRISDRHAACFDVA